MVQELFLCCLAFGGGFIAADRWQPLIAWRYAGWSFTKHRSYGGVTRPCPRSGGFLLMMTLVSGMLPLSVFMILFVGLSALVLAVAAFGVMRERAASLLPRGASRFVLVGLGLVVPDEGLLLLPWVVLFGARYWIALEAQDRVAGIPAALHAPPLAAGGAVLVLGEPNWIGLFGLITAGGLLGVHALHRFPPRLVYGRSGLLILAGVEAITVMARIDAGACLAIGMAWSLPLVGTVHGAFRPFNGFEIARWRGEPESGLAYAAGSLSCANGVLVCTTLAQPVVAQLAALALSLFLAWQFHRFLVRPSRYSCLHPP